MDFPGWCQEMDIVTYIELLSSDRSRKSEKSFLGFSGLNWSVVNLLVIWSPLCLLVSESLKFSWTMMEIIDRYVVCFQSFFGVKKIFFFGTKNVVFFQRSRRSRSVPPALIVPAPRRRYPSEVEDPPCNPPSFLSSS